MPYSVRIGGRLIGDGQPAACLAEIGVNHNGSVAIAKQLIDIAKAAGSWACKFQKRTVDVVYSPEELARPRESPFGSTNGDLKRGLEFSLEQYIEIDHYCREVGMPWFASCWDEQSVMFIERNFPHVQCHKIASACLTDLSLLECIYRTGKPVILSTGMSTLDEVDEAVEALGENLVLMACTASYPAQDEDLNLRRIQTLKNRYGYPTGWSGHESGLEPSVAAVALGANCIERHVCRSRTDWGSDQAASLEPHGLEQLIRRIRTVETALGSGEIRLLDCEKAVKDKLRRIK